MISYVSPSVLCMDVVDAVNLEIACSLCSVVSLVEYCAETCNKNVAVISRSVLVSKVMAPAGNRQEHSVRLCHPSCIYPWQGCNLPSFIVQRSLYTGGCNLKFRAKTCELTATDD